MPSSATETHPRIDQKRVRSNKVGGSLDNRIRFAVEVATAVADEIGHADHPTDTA
ncbi:hypothetical protein ACH4GM_31845 [Streptomyces coeruleorubidus]|uniref:hypothetical protein n=1 Tax=Streptomyces coeruleorubidus TaxID=116188 RepID=UPI0037A386F1